MFIQNSQLVQESEQHIKEPRLEIKSWAPEMEDISMNSYISAKELQSYRGRRRWRWCDWISISEYKGLSWWMLSLEPPYRKLRVVRLISSRHKPIKIDPRTTVPANPNRGPVALHRSAEHHRGALGEGPKCVKTSVKPETRQFESIRHRLQPQFRLQMGFL